MGCGVTVEDTLVECIDTAIPSCRWQRQNIDMFAGSMTIQFILSDGVND